MKYLDFIKYCEVKSPCITPDKPVYKENSLQRFKWVYESNSNTQSGSETSKHPTHSLTTMNDTNTVIERVDDAQRLNNVFDAQIQYEYLSYDPDIVYQEVQEELDTVSSTEVDVVADFVEEKTGVVFTKLVRERATTNVSDMDDVTVDDVLVELFTVNSRVRKYEQGSGTGTDSMIFQMFIKVRSVGMNTTKAIRHFIMKIASQTRLTNTKTTNPQKE